MTKTIVVTGVTGTQGGSVASTFLKLDGWHVRGITRNPSSESAKAQAARGIEMVKGDLSDTKSLISAFQGANAIFVATDYWGGLQSPDTAKQAELTGKPIFEVAYDLEVAQNINAAAAASEPNVLATLERFVLSTLEGPRKRSGGKYSLVYHFDSKADAADRIRKEFPAVTKLMSTLNMGVYTENWKDNPIFAPNKQEDGSFAFLTLRPKGTHEEWPLVVASRDTGVFVEALVTRLEPGINLLGVSAMMTRAEYAALWGKVRGVQAVERIISEEEFLNLFPALLQKQMLETFDAVSEYGHMMGNSSTVLPWDLQIPTTSLEQYIQEEDWDAKVEGKF